MITRQEFSNWLEEHIRTLAPGTRLMTDTEMAKNREISPRTVRRVMDNLKKKGIVSRIPGSGTFTAKTEKPSLASAASDSVTSAERLAVTLQQSILRGELRQGDPLPQSKYLCLQYRISEKTVVAAYKELVKRNLAQKIGKRYWVGNFMPTINPSARKRVYIFAGHTEDFRHIFSDDFLGQAYQKFERELRARNIALRFDLLDNLQSRISSWTNTALFPAGLVLWKIEGEQFDRFLPIVKPLLGSGRASPKISVLADLQSIARTDRAPAGMNVLARGNLTTAQARSAASFLERMPKRDIVLFFDSAAIQKDPRRAYIKFYKIMYEILNLSGGKRRIFQVIIGPMKSTSVGSIIEKALSKEAEYLRYLDKKYSGAGAIKRDDLGATTIVMNNFRPAIKRFGGNAVWLFTTDALADLAVPALSRNGIKVPQQVALVSLENNPGFFHLELSACTPDWDLVGYFMAHAILGDLTLEKTGRKFIKVPCLFIERRTTPPL